MIINTLYRSGCPLRNGFGKCTAYRGYCTSVTQDICDALRQAYAQGRFERTDDMMPVRRGHWISYADLHSSCCSECNAWWIPWGEGYKETYRYCPNCGAKMDL